MLGRGRMEWGHGACAAIIRDCVAVAARSGSVSSTEAARCERVILLAAIYLGACYTDNEKITNDLASRRGWSRPTVPH